MLRSSRSDGIRFQAPRSSTHRLHQADNSVNGSSQIQQFESPGISCSIDCEINLLGDASCFTNYPLQLIWAQVDNACCQNRSYIAEKWCQHVLDLKVFENVSRANRSTIKKCVALRRFQIRANSLIGSSSRSP